MGAGCIRSQPTSRYTRSRLASGSGRSASAMISVGPMGASRPTPAGTHARPHQGGCPGRIPVVGPSAGRFKRLVYRLPCLFLRLHVDTSWREIKPLAREETWSRTWPRCQTVCMGHRNDQSERGRTRQSYHSLRQLSIDVRLFCRRSLEGLGRSTLMCAAALVIS